MCGFFIYICSIFPSYFLTIICIKYRCMDIYLCDFICMYPLYMYTCVLCWFNMCCFDWYAVIDLLDLKLCTPDGCPFAPCTGLNAEVMNSSKAWSQTERCACAWVPCHRHKIGSWKTGCWMILKLRGKSDPSSSNPDSESVSAKSKCFKSEGCPSKDSIDWGSHYSGQVDRSSG